MQKKATANSLHTDGASPRVRAREAARTATFEACAKSRPPESQRVPSQGLPDECDRVRLIGDLTRLAQEPLVPDDQRRGCLELIGWLARRMAHEAPHAIGCGPSVGVDPRFRDRGDAGDGGPVLYNRRSEPPVDLAGAVDDADEELSPHSRRAPGRRGP
jgi:hypothetical protein